LDEEWQSLQSKQRGEVWQIVKKGAWFSEKWKQITEGREGKTEKDGG